ncbi:hypothetical protein KY321_01330 [Candidatus Woesearchaeota archaeon]|nr:hypothetical protein [Candidatus Woesearchaeota archaeon]
MSEFTLLKRSYPTSQYERVCDGYDFIINNSTKEERLEWGIDDDSLQKIIDVDEKYVYEVAKTEEGKFESKTYSFKNYKIIRNHILGFQDD